MRSGLPSAAEAVAWLACTPPTLGAHVFTGLFDRVDVDPAAVDDVIVGCVDTIGPQAGNVARSAWLAAGLPVQVPGTVVDRQCGSSQQAVHFAAQAVMSGTAELIVAGGLQNMSALPISSAMLAGREYGFDDPFSGSVGWRKRFGEQPVSQFNAAEMIAQKWDISRDAMEEFALESHRRAARAIDEGRFTGQILPLAGVRTTSACAGTPARRRWPELKTLVDGGRLTAAVSSQISDASAALLIASERRCATMGSFRGPGSTTCRCGPTTRSSCSPGRSRPLLTPWRRLACRSTTSTWWRSTRPSPASVQAWLIETGADPARVNPNGGAIALGHPLGATGARLMTTLLSELERTGGRYGLQTMCEGGGTANVTIIERLG